MHRREFLRRSTIATATLAASGRLEPAARARAKDSVNDRITVAMVGVKGRGNALLHALAGNPGVQLKYVCDVDESVLQSRTDEVASRLGRRPEPIKDFRRALDDEQVDAIVLGTPDHWHALPTIMACQAGKDVYVEKPDGHNLIEGRTMVAAARKYARVVQLGTQARSDPSIHAAMDYIRAGNLGKEVFVKAWESSKQRNLGRPADTDAPSTVDYDFWLGPAPKRPFNPLRFHGNWRWFFDYGTGDLGNDGVHRLDFGLWALQTAIVAGGGQPVSLPRSVSASGGKYYFDDAQEWPDTLMVTYDYPGYVLTYEMRIWSPYPFEGESEGAALFGDAGYIVLGNRRWRAYDDKGQLVREEPRSDHTARHVQNFLDCMRSRAKPAADLETVGHPSSILCHLGNAAWRCGRTLRFDAESYTFVGDEQANQYLSRAEYRHPWRLPGIAEL